MRLAVSALALLTLLAVGCTDETDAALLLLPADGGSVPTADVADLPGTPRAADTWPDPRAARLVDAVPDADPDSCQAEWTAPPTDAPVVAVPDTGYTLVRTGPVADVTLTLVCDYDADGELVVADDLRQTGTDRSVGNDYAVRAGAIAGRVDVGIPEEAVTAVQSFADWSLVVPLDPRMAVVRLHAREGSGDQTGFDIGTVTFLDADGTDVTAASVPIPDVVHGVPRNRGSSVNPRD